jgi:two-component system cell cycle sensor histidine kinase/response regulator CckA
MEEVEGGTLTVKSSNIEKENDWECAFNNLHPAGRYVSIDISNTGPGIPEEISEQIFEPFYTTKSLGRGLGLAAVAGIVQNHGGCVSFKNAPKGTTFHILLPIAQENSNGPGKKILQQTDMTLDLDHVH